MRLSKGLRHKSLAFNLTPMVDVVFLLIIFFMTVSQISKINSQFLQIPEVGPLETGETPITLTINLLESGVYLFEGNSTTLDELISFVQAITSLQEQSVSQGIKLVAVTCLLVIAGPWGGGRSESILCAEE